MNTTELDNDKLIRGAKIELETGEEAGEKYSFPTGNKTRCKAGHSKIK